MIFCAVKGINDDADGAICLAFLFFAFTSHKLARELKKKNRERVREKIIIEEKEI